jgi:hypothetical protein
MECFGVSLRPYSLGTRFDACCGVSGRITGSAVRVAVTVRPCREHRPSYFFGPHFHAGRRAFKGDSPVETGRDDCGLNITLTALNNGIQATSFGALSIENCNINGRSGGIVIAGKQRRQRGLAVPPLADVQEDIRTTLKSTRLQQEVDKWTTELRSRANMDIYTWR